MHLRSQTEFHLAEVTTSIPSNFVKKLDNGKSISLFFHGIENRITIKKGKNNKCTVENAVD